MIKETKRRIYEELSNESKRMKFELSEHDKIDARIIIERECVQQSLNILKESAHKECFPTRDAGEFIDVLEGQEMTSNTFQPTSAQTANVSAGQPPVEDSIAEGFKDTAFFSLCTRSQLEEAEALLEEMDIGARVLFPSRKDSIKVLGMKLYNRRYKYLPIKMHQSHATVEFVTYNNFSEVEEKYIGPFMSYLHMIYYSPYFTNLTNSRDICHLLNERNAKFQDHFSAVISACAHSPGVFALSWIVNRKNEKMYFRYIGVKPTGLVFSGKVFQHIDHLMTHHSILVVESYRNRKRNHRRLLRMISASNMKFLGE